MSWRAACSRPASCGSQCVIVQSMLLVSFDQIDWKRRVRGRRNVGPRTVGGERVCVCVAFFCRKREGDARASVPFPPRGARGSPGLLATRRPRPVTESCLVFVRRALRPSGPPQRSDRYVEHRIQLNMYLLEVKEIRLSMTRAGSKDYPYAYSTHIDSSPAGRRGCGLHHRQKSLLLYQTIRTYTIRDT